MLVPMAKVEIIGPKNLFFDVVGLLHDRGNLHIEDLSRKIQTGSVPLDQMEVYARQQEERERMEEMLIRVRAILKALPSPDGGTSNEDRAREYDSLWQMDSDQLADEVAAVIEEVEDRTSALAAAHTSLEGELALLARYEPILQKIQPLAKQIVTTGAFDSVALLFERRYKAALEQLKEELDRLTHKQCEIVSTDVDDDTTAAIVVFNKAYAEPVHKFLAMENVNQIRLPSEFEGMPFDAAYDAIRQRKTTLPTEADGVAKDLGEMSKRWFAKLATIRDVLIDKIDEISAIPKFGRTEYAFVVEGWLPVEELKPTEQAIRERWGEDIIVNQLEIVESEYAETPVALRNPKAIEPFQKLLSVYGVPRYGTVDPTFFLFLFYPLFFGMIVGDMGYGAIMLGIVLWLRRRFRDNDGVQIATSILGPAATLVVAFGIVYGEMFGNLPHQQGWVAGKPTMWFGTLPTFDRVHAIEAFMYLAVAVGVIHIVLGLGTGVVNAVRTKHKKHLYEKGGILTFLVAVALAVAVGYATEHIGEWKTWAQALFALVALVGLVFAIRGGGVMGAVDTVESIAHMASYIRIMAVGLAGAIFADAVNEIAIRMDNIVLAAVIAVVLHSLNFVIAAFSPTIHALRLNFLEFFGKFYETGKQEYKPFKKTGGEKSA